MGQSHLAQEINAFQRQQPELRLKLGDAWVVFVDEDCRGNFATFNEAANFALKKFRDQDFLIRHTNDAPPVVPMLFVDE